MQAIAVPKWRAVGGNRNCTTTALSIIYSAKPIKQPRLVAAWWEWTRGRPIKTMLDEGREPPALLRSIIDAYRKAVKAAQADGEDVMPAFTQDDDD